MASQDLVGNVRSQGDGWERGKFGMGVVYKEYINHTSQCQLYTENTLRNQVVYSSYKTLAYKIKPPFNSSCNAVT
jgi:hypothetical protein